MLSIKELELIISHATGDLKHIITIAINTGMRKGEILKLKWDEIDLDEKILRTRSKAINKRDILLNPILENLFLKLEITHGDRIYVFENPKTGKPYLDIKSGWRPLLKKLQIEDFRFHDLRHCYASYSIRRGMDISVLQEILGHTQLNTTRRYVKKSVESQRRYINNFCIGDKEFE